MSNSAKEGSIVALQILGVFHDSETVLPPSEGSEDGDDGHVRIPVEYTCTDIFIRSGALKSVKISNQKRGLTIYDPYFYNTAITCSCITRSDSQNSKLYFRGYDMEQLVETSDFLSVAYLLIYGGSALPSAKRAHEWKRQVLTHTYLHEDILQQLRTFRYDAHPCGMLISAFAALSTFHPEANPSLQGPRLYDGCTAAGEAAQNKQIFRILGKVITIAACAYRIRIGRPFNKPPPPPAGYTDTFLAMLDQLSEPRYVPHPRLARLLDKLFIALIDDGMNCASGMLRHVASTKVDPYTAIASALGAHYGSRISGVGDAVLGMLNDIAHPDRVAQYVADAKRTGTRLQGFGHLNYKCYDPRCRVVKKIAYEVAALIRDADAGDGEGERLLEIANALEEHVAGDDYYTKRKVYANVDLYLPVATQLMGFPTDFYAVFVSIPRVAGLVAHWRECTMAQDARIARPRQLYEGEPHREYVPIEQRSERDQSGPIELATSQSQVNRRRVLARRGATAPLQGT